MPADLRGTESWTLWLGAKGSDLRRGDSLAPGDCTTQPYTDPQTAPGNGGWHSLQYPRTPTVLFCSLLKWPQTQEFEGSPDSSILRFPWKCIRQVWNSHFLSHCYCRSVTRFQIQNQEKHLSLLSSQAGHSQPTSESGVITSRQPWEHPLCRLGRRILEIT